MGRFGFWGGVCYIYQKLFLKAMGWKSLLESTNTISSEVFLKRWCETSFWSGVCYIYQKLFFKPTVWWSFWPHDQYHPFRSFSSADGVSKLPGEFNTIYQKLSLKSTESSIPGLISLHHLTSTLSDQYSTLIRTPSEWLKKDWKCWKICLQIPGQGVTIKYAAESETKP